ncbi:MAG: cupin domain-containing protein [Planctomycetaceae bacterium]|jgi:cupin 2 domain-containing protein|nr:cupin domain-containing protein [Planctomycetaceae bacterium]
MKLFDDVKSPTLLYIKGGLFGILAATTALALFAAEYIGQKTFLLAICLWSSCRFYYFFFYVLEHYVGGNKNSSIFAMTVKLFRKNHLAQQSSRATFSLPQNLFTELPKSLLEEWIETLANTPSVRIERIVSTGHASPPDFWYDQTENEWVVVLRGNAVLTLENETRRLSSGDYLLIPAHQKHRVDFTSTDEPTVWLAVFFQ